MMDRVAKIGAVLSCAHLDLATARRLGDPEAVWNSLHSRFRERITPLPTTRDLIEPFSKQIIRAPVLIASERRPELWEEVLRQHKWEFEFTDGPAQFFPDTGGQTILASYAGLAAVWSLAFAAYHTLDVVLREQQRHRGCAGGPASVDIGREWQRLRLREYIAFATQLTAQDEAWPAGLAMPNAKAPFNCVEGRINNAFLGATAWLLLHEVAHIRNRDVNDNRLRKMQETRADAFATGWVLDKAGTGRRREFRILMITIALAFLFVYERRHGTRATYPPAHARLEAAATRFGGGKRSVGLLSAATVLKTMLDPTSSAPQPFDNATDYFRWVSTLLA